MNNCIQIHLLGQMNFICYLLITQLEVVLVMEMWRVMSQVQTRWQHIWKMLFPNLWINFQNTNLIHFMVIFIITVTLNYQLNGFIVFGESYGGKFSVVFSSTIMNVRLRFNYKFIILKLLIMIF